MRCWGHITVILLTVVVDEAQPSFHCHHMTPASNPHQRMVSVAVWSGERGWGLDVDACQCQSLLHNTLRCGGMEDSGLVREGWKLPDPTATPPQSPATSPTGGITLNVLNQRTGVTIFHKIFPLLQYWAHWADLKWHLERVAPGRIVVMTVAVSGTTGLRDTAHLLAQLGSLFALHLTPTTHWTWIFIKGGRTISETTILRGYTTHFAHLILPLLQLPTPATSDKDQQVQQEQRWQYCAAHAAMGGLCDEYDPDPMPVPTPPAVAHQSAIASVPVVVTAGSRNQYIYHTLTTLLTTPGAQQNNIMVILGDAPQSTTQLLHLFNISFTRLNVHGNNNNELFHYYRNVFQFVAHKFSNAPAVIFLDEDVEVSPDFFSYMSQTLWLLLKDPSIYCINAYSATGFYGTAYDPRTIVRARVQVEWGYALTLTFIKEAIRMWPSKTSEVDTLFYDEWLYMHVSNGRECVFPEVSRTLHFGIGVNTQAWFTELYFLSKPLVKQSHISLDNVCTLLLEHWKEHFSRSIKQAIPLTGNPCGTNFVPHVNTSTNFVFYYNMLKMPDGQPNYTNFFFAAKCLNAWGSSPQGLHERVLTVRVSKLATLYLVGAPYSPYGYLLPPYIRPWDHDSITEEDEDIILTKIRELEMGKYEIKNQDVTSDYLTSILFVN
ncbi:protein O-linked-mannose beta-1,2-N-acetylglucosaminyltransferase 1 isoform X1 [Procambarus clarkii]|uniref:protein O-linked-mannose beta-1,2-N-acetylglucosaminyltransferase 1 isoform X1 n=2 Tax=Procambarus clarkii TaxID=6728 RepID=UPI001E673B76|nr:protein O-linked-mannose beta-1,2-N-acetylglucosaminyltransferase 1-like [Procambarus clarkii]